MTLQVGNVDLTFSPPEGVAGGVREDLDPRVAPLGTWRTLDNVVFLAEGSISPRNGYAPTSVLALSVGNALRPAPTLTLMTGQVQRIDALDRRLLLTWTNQLAGDDQEHLVSYDAGSERWVELDWTCPASVTRTPAARVAGQLGLGQCVPVGDLTFSIWDTEQQGIWISAKNTETGAVVVRPQKIPATVLQSPVLIRDGLRAIVVGIGGTILNPTIVAWHIDTTDPSYALTLSTLRALSSDSVVDRIDACPQDAGHFTTVYFLRGASDFQIDRWQTATWTSVASDVTTAGTTPSQWTIASTLGSVWVAWHESTGTPGVYARKYDPLTLAPAFASTLVSNEATAPMAVSVGIQGGLYVDDAVVAWSGPYSDGTNSQPSTRICQIAGNPVTAPMATLFRCFLHSRPFTAPDGHVYAVTFVPYGDEPFGSLAQGAYGATEFSAQLVCLDANWFGPSAQNDPFLAGRFAVSEAWTWASPVGQAPKIPRAHVLSVPGSSTRWQTSLEVITGGVFVPSQGDTTSRTGAIVGLDTLTFDFGPAHSRMLFTPAPGGGAVTSGAFTGYFDGGSFVELGFSYGPWVKFAPINAGGGTPVFASGTYRYLAVYEWIDRLGVTHVSAPSVPGPPVIVDTTSPSWNHNTGIRLTLGTSPLTRRGKAQDGDSPVTIAIYREDPASPGTYYRLTGRDPRQAQGLTTHYNWAPPVADKTMAAVTWDDVVPPSQLALLGLGSLTLPGAPANGPLVADPPPPFLATCSHVHRLWGISADDPWSVYISKEFVRGEAPAFSLTSQFVRLDDAPEGATALAGFNDKLLIWTPSRLYYTYGEGWSDTGQGAGYAEPVLVSADAGCVQPQSIVTTSAGVFFLGRGRGGDDFYATTGGEPPVRIGAGVQDTLAAYPTVLQASADPSRMIVVWLLSNGTDTKCVVWSYAWNRWVTWTTTVFSQTDPPAPSISQCFVDGIHFHATAQGVYRETQSGPTQYLDPSGSPVSPTITTQWIHPATAVGGYQRHRRIALNIQMSAPLTFLVERFVDYDAATLDESYTFAATSPGPVTEVAHVGNQKVQAFQLSLTTVAPAFSDPDRPEGGFSMTSITCEIGAKRGVAKVGQGNRS